MTQDQAIRIKQANLLWAEHQLQLAVDNYNDYTFSPDLATTLEMVTDEVFKWTHHIKILKAEIALLSSLQTNFDEMWTIYP